MTEHEHARQQGIARFQSERAQAFIEQAAGPLVAERLAYRGILKQGEVAFSILDAAEELDYHEIAMPNSRCSSPLWMFRRIARGRLSCPSGVPSQRRKWAFEFVRFAAVKMSVWRWRLGAA